MSVITCFEVESKEKQNIAKILEDGGFAKKTGQFDVLDVEWDGSVPKQKKAVRYRYELDLPKLHPEYWEKDLAAFLKNGIRSWNTFDLDFGCKWYLDLNDPMRTRLDEGLHVMRYDWSYKGFYVCDKECSKESQKFIRFTDEEIELIKKEGKRELENWTPIDEYGHRRDLPLGNWLRKGKYTVCATEDGSRIYWICNYADWFDEGITDYVVANIKDIVLHYRVVTESHIDCEGDFFNDEYTAIKKAE